MNNPLHTLSERVSVAYSHIRGSLGFRHPYARDNHYTAPPSLIRYTVERWSQEDERDNAYAGESYAPTYCIGCYGMHGAYCVGEHYIDDTLSADTFHVTCVPTLVRVRAIVGMLLCALRAVLGIDRRRTHQL